MYTGLMTEDWWMFIIDMQGVEDHFVGMKRLFTVMSSK